MDIRGREERDKSINNTTQLPMATRKRRELQKKKMNSDAQSYTHGTVPLTSVLSWRVWTSVASGPACLERKRKESAAIRLQ